MGGRWLRPRRVRDTAPHVHDPDRNLAGGTQPSNGAGPPGGRWLSDARGFTFIELLVTLGIIAIVAAIVAQSLKTARNRSKERAIDVDKLVPGTLR